MLVLKCRSASRKGRPSGRSPGPLQGLKLAPESSHFERRVYYRLHPRPYERPVPATGARVHDARGGVVSPGVSCGLRWAGASRLAPLSPPPQAAGASARRARWPREAEPGLRVRPQVPSEHPARCLWVCRDSVGFHLCPNDRLTRPGVAPGEASSPKRRRGLPGPGPRGFWPGRGCPSLVGRETRARGFCEMQTSPPGRQPGRTAGGRRFPIARGLIKGRKKDAGHSWVASGNLNPGKRSR